MKFVAIDVETANPDLSGTCQIGVVSFDNGSIGEAWQRFVDPEDYFDPLNVSVHGITEDAIAGAPTLPDLFSGLEDMLSQQIVVCHTSFDRLALNRATEKYGLPGIACTWLDSARIVRRAWPRVAYSGYGLASITEALGIVFQHHVAQEDAHAAGQVVLRAIADTGISLDGWLKRSTQSMSREASSIALEGNPEGPLIGEVAVFIGTLSIPRREAARLAASAGCSVANHINNDTTLLIVGDQDIRRLVGHEKSSKHRKAEELISRGNSIRILGESDFRRIVGIEVAK